MDDVFLGEWQAWRTRREERLTAPDGYLAITGLHWLDDRLQRFDGVPGEWRAVGPDAEVLLATGERLEVEGEPVTGRHLFNGLSGHPVRARHGDAVLEIGVRSGTPMLRPRDPGHRLRREHVQTPTYPPSPDWVVTARFHPYDEPERIPIETVIEHVGDAVDAVGEVEFEIGGEVQRLVAFAEDDEGRLWLLFADGTSGDTTYRCRELVTAPPAEGVVRIDFNRATNLPCAYTPYSTCPLPPAQNRLQVRIEAGERLPEKQT